MPREPEWSGRIDTVDGSVYVVGTVLDGRGSGVYAKRNFITATGVGPDAGEIRITGTGSENPADYGLYINDARISTVDTDIVLVGVTGLVVNGQTTINSTGTGSDAGTLAFIGGHHPEAYDVAISEPTDPFTTGTTRIYSAGGEIAYIGDEIVGGPVVENPYGTTSVAPFTAGLPIHLGSAIRRRVSPLLSFLRFHEIQNWERTDRRHSNLSPIRVQKRNNSRIDYGWFRPRSDEPRTAEPRC